MLKTDECFSSSYLVIFIKFGILKGLICFLILLIFNTPSLSLLIALKDTWNRLWLVGNIATPFALILTKQMGGGTALITRL